MKNNATILLVDDDQVDVMTVKRAFKDINLTNPLFTCANGEEALLFLRDPGAKLPSIILLDVNMPRMNGIETLKHLKSDPILKMIPVIMLTTSKEESDKHDAYNQGIAGYLIKPVNYIQFVKAMKTLDMYWTMSELHGIE